MKITVVGINYRPEPTGIAVYTSAMASGLQVRGHSVRVITGYPHYPEWRIRDGYSGIRIREGLDGVAVDRVRHTVPTAPSALSRIKMEITFAISALLVRTGKPDVFVCVSPTLISAAAVTISSRLRRKKVPVVVWVQDIYTAGVVETESLSGFSAKLTKMLEGVVLRRASRVVVIHDRFGAYVERELGVSADKIICIRNWSHVEQPRKADSKLTRKRYGWAEDEIVVLHAGNMGAKQYLDNVVEASEISQNTESNVRFVLLGDGNQRSRLEGLAQGLSKIDFIDPVDSEEFGNLLQASDVLLVNEGAGVVDMAVPSKLTTYFAAGRPIVAVTEEKSVTAAEIRASRAGVIVEPENPAALVRVIESTVANRDLCEDLAHAGKVFSREMLSSNSALEKFERTIYSAVSDFSLSSEVDI